MLIKRVLGSGLVAVLVATTVAVATAPTAALAAAPLIDGGQYTITNLATGKNLAVNGGQDQNGAKVIQYRETYTNGHVIDDQVWELDELGGGYWGIRNLGTNPHKALAINNHGLVNGVGAIQYDYHPEYADQVWYFPSQGSYWKLQNLNSGKCLAIAGGEVVDGKQAIQYDCLNYNDQLWVLNLVN